MREQNDSTVGRFDWGIQKLLAQENGHDGASLSQRYILRVRALGWWSSLGFCNTTHDFDQQQREYWGFKLFLCLIELHEGDNLEAFRSGMRMRAR